MGTPFKHARDGFEARCAGMGIIPDPGNAGVIQVLIDQGTCLLRSGGSAETRILNKTPNGTNSNAANVPAGTEISLLFKTDGGGDITMTFDGLIDGTNNVVVFDQANDYIKLRSDGTNWKMLNNLGCTLA